MHTRRIILPILLIAILTVSIAGCGNPKPQEETSQISTQTPVPTETLTPTPTEFPTTAPTQTPTVTAIPTETPTPTETPVPTETPAPTEEPIPTLEPAPVIVESGAVSFDPSWEFGSYSVINSGTATLYRAAANRKGIVVGVNAGHGTEGGSSQYTYCHPDGTPKVTGGTTAAGSTTAMAASSGMSLYDGTPERDVNLQVAQYFKNLLLENGYDVLMIRDGVDVQLDNIARTVLCNQYADCHIAIHYDGDGLDYDKGCFYMAVPEGLKTMYPVSEMWSYDDQLGECLISGLSAQGLGIFSGGSMEMDLTQTSFSTIPSVDIELGNAASSHSEEDAYQRALGLLSGVNLFFGF